MCLVSSGAYVNAYLILLLRQVALKETHTVYIHQSTITGPLTGFVNNIEYPATMAS